MLSNTTDVTLVSEETDENDDEDEEDEEDGDGDKDGNEDGDEDEDAASLSIAHLQPTSPAGSPYQW